jgi:hypothetical protein
MNRPISTSLFLLGAVATANAQTMLRALPGATGDRLGAAVCRAGDQNGDGVEDLLVGAPGVLSGKLVCISGDWLATGNGTQVLWTLISSASLGGQFGSQIVNVGNLTGDATDDYVVSAPLYRPPASQVTMGALYVVDGKTHLVVNFINGEPDSRLGIKLAAVGDVDGDGLPDVAATATYTTTFGANKVYVIPGSSLLSGPPGLGGLPHWTMIGADGFGDALASGFDLNADGHTDLAVSSTREGSGNTQDAGAVFVFDPRPGFALLGMYKSPNFGEHLGKSLDVRHDYDKDGVVDIVAGAPDWRGPTFETDGRGVVISGAHVLSGNGPFEIYSFLGGSGGSLQPGPGWRLGSTVCASDDVNGDGVGDLVIGMPDYYTQLPFGPGRGGVRVFSGATGHWLGGISGVSNEHFGDTLLGAFADLNGDGFPEMAMAGSSADNPSTDCGVLKVYSPFISMPTTYCTGKQNSQLCTPSIWTGGSGFASATSPDPFLVTCTMVINQKAGLMFYSHAPLAAPFQGGFLCVKSPKRTPAQNSNGSTIGVDCTGTYSYDFTPVIQNGVDPTMVPGAEVFCQWWSRDSLSPSGTSLSNGLHFVINP